MVAHYIVVVVEAEVVVVAVVDIVVVELVWMENVVYYQQENVLKLYCDDEQNNDLLLHFDMNMRNQVGCEVGGNDFMLTISFWEFNVFELLLFICFNDSVSPFLN